MLKSLKNLRIAAVAALFLSLAGSGAADAIEAVDARVGVHPDKTRFVLELSQDVPYRIFTLPSPYRVVVDLPEIDWRVPMTRQQASQGLISNFRFGLFQPGTSRVVIDATGPTKVDAHFVIPARDGKPNRLVLDLVPITAAAFAESGTDIRSPGWQNFALGRPDSPPPPPRQPDSLKVVVLDPGHGGVDPGAIGVSGIYEKTITLSAAKVIAEKLEASGRYRVFLTRTRDIYIPLRDRFGVAQARNADLFLSIHADSIGSDKVSGASVYTLSNTSSDRETELLAEKENKSDIIAGIDLSGYSSEVSEILIDFAQGATNEQSWAFAELLVPELKKRVRLLRRPHRFAGFAVLKSPNVPSLLLEMGYLSNHSDERELRTRRYQERFAEAVLEAVDAYFAQKDRMDRS